MPKQHPMVLLTKLHHVSIKFVFYSDILEKPLCIRMADLLIYPSKFGLFNHKVLQLFVHKYSFKFTALGIQCYKTLQI